MWNVPACIMHNCCSSDRQLCIGVSMSVWSDATRYISKAQLVTSDSLNRGMLNGGWNGRVCLGKWAIRCDIWCLCRLCILSMMLVHTGMITKWNVPVNATTDVIACWNVRLKCVDEKGGFAEDGVFQLCMELYALRDAPNTLSSMY